MGKQMIKVAVVSVVMVLVGIALTEVATAAPTATTWTGMGADSNWDTAGNWSNGVPIDKDWQAIIPNGTGALDFTGSTGIPATLNRLQTGDGLVTFASGMNFAAATGYSPAASFSGGTGGVTFGGSVSFTNGGWSVTTAGTTTINGNMTLDNISGTPVTTTGAGTFAITGLAQVAGVGGTISGLAFTGAPATISANTYPTQNFIFSGSPTFTGGQRPNWDIDGLSDTGIKWDLNGQTITGNTVTVRGGPGTPATRHAYLYDGVGGVVDANVLQIGGTYYNAYIDMHGSSIEIRGGGTAWSNGSTNNTKFDITDGTTVTFHASANVDSGSQDQGLSKSAWVDNFAFDAIQLADGVTLTLAGDANIGGGNNALYASSLEALGSTATVLLNGHNLYLLADPIGTITFDTSLGGSWAVIPEPASLTVLVLGMGGLVRRRRR